MTTDRNERQARKLLALGLDEFGHHTEAANVRAGIDLDDYRVDLWAIRAALDSQTAAAPGIDLTPLWRLSDEWLKALGVRGLGNEEKRLRWALAKELRDALSLIDASPKGTTLNEQFGSAEGLGSPKGGSEAQPMFYIQDTRSFVGNCPMWWGPEGRGYVTRLDEAGRYTEEEAIRQNRARDTDIPWPCDEINKLARPTVDFQHMRPRSERLAELAPQASDAEVRP